MDYSIFFNHLSLPGPSRKKSYELLYQSFQGVLELNKGNDRFFLYLDLERDEKMKKRKLFDSFYYCDFKEELKHKNETDLLSFIQEMEDKAPNYDHIHNSKIKQVIYIEVQDIDIKEYDDVFDRRVLLLAFLEDNGITLSLATNNIWGNYAIDFKSWRENSNREYSHRIYNIAQKKHGKIIKKEYIIGALKKLSNIHFTETFFDWLKKCDIKDQDKIKDKILHCHRNKFQLERPTIDTINLGKSSIKNMKEIRVGKASGQKGAIRLLFVNKKNRETIILLGFIKHSNNYSKEIEEAKKILKELN